MFTYTSLAPEGHHTRAALLEFDGVRILADPGWDGISDITYLDKIVPTVDMIIISHPTTEFLGAYAYLAFHDLKIPVYATLPVCNLGRVSTLDLFRSIGLLGPLKGTELELKDVEEAFDKIITVKHSQTTDLRAKYDGLSLTAINGGHTLGGAIWVITKNSEKIIYAPEWNHSKDSFLNGADLLQNSTLLRPSVIITSTAIGSVLPHKKRVEKFFELVDATLGRGGTVLLPTSIGGRMLELVHLIDDHLQSAPIPVLLLSYTKARNLTYAGSMLEWMAPAVIREWESRGQPPFDSSRVQVIEPNELLNLPGAKVVFASGAGFEDGSVAQAALMSLCDDEKTTILLTEKVAGNTIASDLFFTWESLAKSQAGKAEDGVPVALQKQLTVSPIREDILIGDELLEYQNHVKERRARNEQNKKAKLADKKETQFEDESESESEDEDILSLETKKKEKIPIDVDVRNAKGRAKVFQFIPRKAKYDDYGEIINHSDYAREEEKDVGKLKRNKANNKVQIGEKRKWNEGKKQDDTSDLDALHEPKVRTISQLLVNSRCVLSFVDLSGIVDIRSLSLIIPALKPKKVFLLHDLTDPSNYQKVYSVLNKHNNFEVCELKPNEPISAKDTVQSFEILLDEKLADQLKWQKIAGGFTVAHVMGNVKTRKQIEDEEVKEEVEGEVKEENGETSIKSEKDDTTSGDSKEQSAESRRHDEELVLTPLDHGSTFLANIRATQLAIGDVKLSELKKSLSMTHRVEFKGEGTLVVDDIVAVRKISDGDVVVDGAPGKLFYEVREAVRDMLAYV